ncbi:MAG TPA: dienelactone hydrolase family protein [Bacteroidota bacterium]|nr:dienelactone hydrolase family protein [Bacteroidota bacterium]
MYISRPPLSGKRPGILVFQEAFGVNAHIREVADRFAQEGYVAAAPEMYHRTGPGFEGDYKDFASTQIHFTALHEETVGEDILAAYQWLVNDPSVDKERTACIGFCMGGRFAFQANTMVPIRASVSFYGGGIAEGFLGRVAQLHGAVLMFWGGRDKRILPEHIRSIVDALRASEKVYTNVEFSQAEHGFFNDARTTYHKESAEEAWGMTLRFLKEHC